MFCFLNSSFCKLVQLSKWKFFKFIIIHWCNSTILSVFISFYYCLIIFIRIFISIGWFQWYGNGLAMVWKRHQNRQLTLLLFISDSNIKAFKQSNSLRIVCLLFLLIIYWYNIVFFLNYRCAVKSEFVNLFDVFTSYFRFLFDSF